jgi:two-component system nitrogen regulation response regulator GlnG
MAKIWVADDDASIRTILEEVLSESFDVSVFADGEALLESLSSSTPDAIITDIKMPNSSGYDVLAHINNNFPDLPVIVMTAFTDMQAAIDSYGAGAFEYLPKPFDLEDVLSVLNKAVSKSDALPNKKVSKTDIIGSAASMQMVFRSIGKLSHTNATVMILGESGTGKELVANSLHKNSPRSDMPFIALNMADIPKELIESELFGHEKGAFTGAVEKRVGRFEQANGGTLFLDEIGDMPLDTQTRLLRVLSNKEFYRVGGDSPVKVDVRILAATHQSLETLVAEGKFREDLFYRLNVIKINIPPLRDRVTDIPELANFFLKKHSASMNEAQKNLSDAALEKLSTYSWPGNVRELENICYWLTLMAPSQVIAAEDLPNELLGNKFNRQSSSQKHWKESFEEWLHTLKSEYSGSINDVVNNNINKLVIDFALKNSGGKKQDAAKLLGISRNTLAQKLKELG